MNYKGNDKYGTLPRRTMIANQPHMLAYINPQEEMLLRQLGGTGQAGPMGVPAYPPGDGGFSPDGGGGYSGGGGFAGFGGSESPSGGGYNDAADAIAAAQQQAIDNAAAMVAADAAIADQMAAAAQEEANAAAMAEAEAAAVAIQDPSDIPTVTTSNISVPEPYAIDTQDTNIYTPNLDGTYSIEDGEPDPEFEPYAIDIQDTNIYTLNDDGTYSIEDGEPDPEPDFDPNEYLGGPGDGGDSDSGTTTTDTLPSSFDRVKYNYNTSLEASPYGGMWSNITSTVPKYEFNAYEDDAGLLRFSDNDELVPPEILKYLGYAKKTLIEEETEEEAA